MDIYVVGFGSLDIFKFDIRLKTFTTISPKYNPTAKHSKLLIVHSDNILYLLSSHKDFAFNL